ncbi:MAG: thioredoxin family protein [Bacteroidota bacterium]
MKRHIFTSNLFLILLIVSSFKHDINSELEIGKPIPLAKNKLLDISGKEVTLNDVKGENGLLVIFSCNTCPYVKLSESRILASADTARRNKIGIILINSNEAQRNEDDSYEEMKKYAISQNYTFHYVVDKNSIIADAFGATRTPHCFLFDKSGLVYRGAIDDNVKDATEVKEHYLFEAMNAIGMGKKVMTNSTKSIGCSIKRLE